MALLDSFPYGDLIRLKGTFTDVDGTLFDPEFVLCEILKPDGTKIVANFGSDANLVTDGVGLYHYDISADMTGLWVYRFESTGTGQTAQRGEFRVDPEFV